MNYRKQSYETPTVEMLEVNLGNGLLQASVNSTRESYGEAVEDEWA
ncbi:MAG: hypothetical protein IKW99_03165 [Bacteroidales bacterium]|nr:hypothetical protein [Bacteroidales bacterium]